MSFTNINKDLVIRFLDNKCTEKEVDSFIEFVKSSSSDAELMNILRDVWDKSENEKTEGNVDFENILTKVHHSIITTQLAKPIITNQTIAKRKTIRKFYGNISKIAAILFIPLLLYTLFNISKAYKADQVLTSSFTEMRTPQGVTANLNLPDGTQVWLNSGSWIKYPEKFVGKKRTVEFKGEAYFKVFHNSSKPFFVKTDELNIKVIGTEFNIENYGDQDDIKTTLVKGKIELQKKLDNGAVKLITQLSPNELLKYNKENKRSVLYKDVNTYKYSAWIDGKTIFENEPMNEVLDRLARKFNVEVEYNENSMAKYSFTATFEDENFEQIISLIKLAIPINYSLEDFKKKDDNSFTRKKYKVELRNL